MPLARVYVRVGDAFRQARRLYDEEGTRSCIMWARLNLTIESTARNSGHSWEPSPRV